MPTKEDLQLKKKIAASDIRIADALEQLADTHRGRNVARELRTFLTGQVMGADSFNWDAVVTLVQEARDGRRDFIGQLKEL